MDHKAHQIQVSKIISDIRALSKDLEDVTDKWPVHSNHTGKMRLVDQLARSMIEKNNELRNLLEAK